MHGEKARKKLKEKKLRRRSSRGEGAPRSARAEPSRAERGGNGLPALPPASRSFPHPCSTPALLRVARRPKPSRGWAEPRPPLGSLLAGFPGAQMPSHGQTSAARASRNASRRACGAGAASRAARAPAKKTDREPTRRTIAAGRAAARACDRIFETHVFPPRNALENRDHRAVGVAQRVQEAHGAPRRLGRGLREGHGDGARRDRGERVRLGPEARRNATKKKRKDTRSGEEHDARCVWGMSEDERPVLLWTEGGRRRGRAARPSSVTLPRASRRLPGGSTGCVRARGGERGGAGRAVTPSPAPGRGGGGDGGAEGRSGWRRPSPGGGAGVPSAVAAPPGLPRLPPPPQFLSEPPPRPPIPPHSTGPSCSPLPSPPPPLPRLFLSLHRRAPSPLPPSPRAPIRDSSGVRALADHGGDRPARGYRRSESVDQGAPVARQRLLGASSAPATPRRDMSGR